MSTIYYFGYLIVLVPLLGSIENALLQLGNEVDPNSDPDLQTTSNKVSVNSAKKEILHPVRCVNSL